MFFIFLSFAHVFLVDLDIDNNQLDGNIPTEIGTLNSLEKLNLGEFITECGECKNIMLNGIPNFPGYNLYWPEHNKLNSTIPTELGNLELLEVLIIGKFSLIVNFNGALESYSK